MLSYHENNVSPAIISGKLAKVATCQQFLVLLTPWTPILCWLLAFANICRIYTSVYSLW